MQQTIFALGALMITMLVAINQQHSILSAQQLGYIRELENAAMDFGTRRLEEIINSTAYDEATVGASDMTFTSGDFTKAGQLGHDGGENVANTATFDDLDDYDGFSETVTHAISADTFLFDITYQVYYVFPSAPGTAAGSPTFTKEIVATIESQDVLGTRRARVITKRVATVLDSF